MKKLQAAGHSLGLHTVHHREAPAFFEKNGGDAYICEEIMPQLERCLVRAHELGMRIIGFNDLLPEAQED